MKEILFRGKIVETGEWIEGHFVTDYEDCYIFTQSEVAKGLDFGGYLDCCQMYEVIPETASQYVGLKDSEGTKIFEGDILESPVKHISQKYGVIVVVTDIRDCKGLALYAADYKVIGNVYDNPEILDIKNRN